MKKDVREKYMDLCELHDFILVKDFKYTLKELEEACLIIEELPCDSKLVYEHMEKAIEFLMSGMNVFTRNVTFNEDDVYEEVYEYLKARNEYAAEQVLPNLFKKIMYNLHNGGHILSASKEDDGNYMFIQALYEKICEDGRGIYDDAFLISARKKVLNLEGDSYDDLITKPLNSLLTKLAKINEEASRLSAEENLDNELISSIFHCTLKSASDEDFRELVTNALDFENKIKNIDTYHALVENAKRNREKSEDYQKVKKKNN